MNKRIVGVLAFAFVVSAGASLLLYRLLSARLAAAARPASEQLAVASRTLEVGALIRDLDLKQVAWTGPAPTHAALKQEDLIGRGVIATIYEGEPILETRLAARGAGAGLAATIPVGMRAVAVRVNDVVGVAGFATPGMRVDILIIGVPPGGTGPLSKVLLQSIEVLSAGQQIQKDAEGKPASVPVVNLLVTPEQAEILSLASNDARIQLVLRNPLDRQETKTPGSALAGLFTSPLDPPPAGLPKPKTRQRVMAPLPPPPESKVKPAIIVEVIHGSKKAEAKFQGKADEQ